MDFAPVRDYLLGLQDRIVDAATRLDGKAFRTDAWTRPALDRLQGDGRSQLVEEGDLLERGGCNFSHVRAPALPPSATAHRPELAGAPFEAMGVSLVFHPRNPHVPTVHMNVRMFAALPAGREAVVWFGGGMDLTPYYGVEDDARHFHRSCRDALAPFGDTLHPRFKRWCDEYFFLKHRNEARGVGGIFFDDFDELGFERSFALMRAVGDAFLPAWLPIAERRRDTPYGERERDFQAYRRGRYVEFNLVYDRGTLFGLQSGGRTESILMSLPPIVKWRYDWQPEPGTPEARLYRDFLPPRDWLAEADKLVMAQRRIGILGGSFDPPHLAHLALGRLASKTLALDELRWLPAAAPWQKAEQVMAPAEDRQAMLALLIEGEPRWRIDARELRRGGLTYTIDSVREMQAEDPAAEWSMIIGQDQYARFHTWRDWRELLQRVTLAVAGRAGAEPQAPATLAALAHRVVLLALPPLDISASDIRRRCSVGAPVAALVGEPIAGYIARHKLYHGS